MEICMIIHVCITIRLPSWVTYMYIYMYNVSMLIMSVILYCINNWVGDMYSSILGKYVCLNKCMGVYFSSGPLYLPLKWIWQVQRSVFVLLNYFRTFWNFLYIIISLITNYCIYHVWTTVLLPWMAESRLTWEGDDRHPALWKVIACFNLPVWNNYLSLTL